jgi:hypothetical protein
MSKKQAQPSQCDIDDVINGLKGIKIIKYNGNDLTDDLIDDKYLTGKTLEEKIMNLEEICDFVRYNKANDVNQTKLYINIIKIQKYNHKQILYDALISRNTMEDINLRIFILSFKDVVLYLKLTSKTDDWDYTSTDPSIKSKIEYDKKMVINVKNEDIFKLRKINEMTLRYIKTCIINNLSII